VNTVEYILRPIGFGAFEGLNFVQFDLTAERRGELLGGKLVQATIRSPAISNPAKPARPMPLSPWRCLDGWRSRLTGSQNSRASRSRYSSQPQLTSKH